MGDSPDRGSPSKQLLAFQPHEPDKTGHRRVHTSPESKPRPLVAVMSRTRQHPFSNWTDQLDLPSMERNSLDAAAASVGLSPAYPKEERAVPVPPWRQNSQGQLGLSGLPDPSYRSPWGSQTVTTRANEPMVQSPRPLVPDQYLSVSQRLPPARRSPSQGGFTAPYDPFGVVSASAANVGNPTAPQGRLDLNLSALVPLPSDNSMNAVPLAPSWDDSTMVGPLAPHPNDMNAVPLAPVLNVGTTFVPTTPSRNAAIMPRRGIIVENMPRNTTPSNVMALFPRHKYDTIEGVNTSQLGSSNRFSIVFGDLREAMNAFPRIGRVWPQSEVYYVTIGEIVDAGLLGPIISDTVQENGQVAIVVNIDAPSPRGQLDPGIDSLVTRVAEAFGGVRYCNRLTVDHATTHEFRVEFFNVHHAQHALVSLNGMELNGYRFKINILPQHLVKIRARRSHPTTSPVTPFKSSPNDTMDMALSSPELLTVDGRHRIDIARIESGEDTRTTIMVRNVPNKYTGECLKEFLDQACFGKFNFIYLRMDFVHHCNVGYAFVNFGDPKDILTLWNFIIGREWPDSTSEKRAQLSYATTQGLEELVAKFRNSAVMLRPAEERPTLFHISGAQVGHKCPFPGPDDMERLRRSLASQQGLFNTRNRGMTGPSPRHRVQLSGSPRTRNRSGTSTAITPRISREGFGLRAANGSRAGNGSRTGNGASPPDGRQRGRTVGAPQTGQDSPPLGPRQRRRITDASGDESSPVLVRRDSRRFSGGNGRR